MYERLAGYTNNHRVLALPPPWAALLHRSIYSQLCWHCMLYHRNSSLPQRCYYRRQGICLSPRCVAMRLKPQTWFCSHTFNIKFSRYHFVSCYFRSKILRADKLVSKFISLLYRTEARRFWSLLYKNIFIPSSFLWRYQLRISLPLWSNFLFPQFR